ncbi:MAG TPA: ABC transporter permease [Chloroflexota bacterium]|nr:ABC transporter permease [Chloroflexota bacterium]
MTHFILRRLVVMAPVVIVVTMLAFSLILLLPGDPALVMLGDQNAMNTEVYHALRTELGLDKPIPIQYVDWLTRALQGNFGLSLRDQLPIGAEIGAHVFPTVELATLAMIFAFLIAVPTATISALMPNSLADAVATFMALGGVAIPHFFLGILLIYVFSLGLHLVPPSGYVPPWQDLGQNLRLMLLPAIALSTGFGAVLMRQIRSALIEAMQQDYIVTARAKGLRERVVIVKHAFKNALIPVIIVVGLEVGTLIGGAVVVESVFSIPGMGRMIVDSINFRDFPSVQAAVLILAVAVLLANLLADFLCGYVDPRIRFD